MRHYQFLLTNIPFNLDTTFAFIRFLALVCAFVVNFLVLFDINTVPCEECSDLGEDADPCVCSQDTPTLLGEGIDAFGQVIVSYIILGFIWHKFIFICPMGLFKTKTRSF